MIFENSFGELVDVVIENNSFRPHMTSAALYTKIGEFLVQDVFDILMKEKTGLKDYDSIKIIRIIESFWRFDENGSIPEKVKYHQVHISCLYDGFVVTGSERIEDLPQKIRDRKLENILND